MADSEGPGRHAPRICRTLTLADLGDTLGWREPGDASEIYGFRLDGKGYYSRTAIAHPDVVAWDIQLELRRGVTYTEHNHMLVRLENMGKCLVSYQACKLFVKVANQPPIVTKQSFLKVVATKPLFYGITATEIKAKTKYCMKARCEFDADLVHLAKLPKNSTIYLELFLGTETPPAEPLPVLPGVSIKWNASAQARHIALILLRGEDGKWTGRTNEEDVAITLLPDIGVDEIIFHPDYSFIRLLFSSGPVSEQHLLSMIAQLKK